MKNELIRNEEYIKFIRQMKYRVLRSQIKAAVSVNRVLLNLYWDMGAQIVEKQKRSKWGDGFLKQLSFDLQKEFPEMRGFSIRNLKYIRQWYLFWIDDLAIGQQLVAQIPWGRRGGEGKKTCQLGSSRLRIDMPPKGLLRSWLVENIRFLTTPKSRAGRSFFYFKASI